jgi:PA domain
VNKSSATFLTLRALLVTGIAALSCVTAMSTHAAKFAIVNGDAPNVGLNDTTPAAPLGGNSGTTLGQQRLIALNYIAAIWGRTLTGTNQTFEVLTQFAARPCTADNGVLASAGPFTVFRDFDNAKFPNTWYPGALANRLAGRDLDTDTKEAFPELAVTTNVNVGNADCIAGSGWYYGLDGNAPADGFDFIKTILHEFGHGVGFLSFVDESTGEFFEGSPSVWEHFLQDNKTNKRWVNMTDAERVASAINNQNLSWAGIRTFIAAQQTLKQASQVDLFIGGGQVGGFYVAGPLQFGAGEGSRRASGLLAIIDDTRAPGAGCNPFTPEQAGAMKRRIAVIKRGGCSFTTKVDNAEKAGAIAVVVDSNNPNYEGRPQLGIPDPALNITIPSVLISQQDGAKIRTAAGGFVLASLLETRRKAGTDLFGRPLMFAPTEVNPGSSVSHFDITATPNLLMEPFAVGDESITLKPPTDLTLPLLQDIGW